MNRSRRRVHMAEPREKVAWNRERRGYRASGRSFEFYDGATKNSLRRVTIAIDFQTRNWTGTVRERRKLGANWKERPATTAEIDAHRAMLSPHEVARITRNMMGID